MKDRDRHGTTANGERHGLAKLNREKVEQARQLWNKGDITLIQLGALYGVSDSTIHSAVTGKTWK
jgi:uncharacterized protein YjcR